MKFGTILGLIFLILFTLKLGVGSTEVQDWSWWLVTAPLWVPLALAAILYAFAGILSGLGYLFTSKEQRKRNAAAKALRNYGRSLR